MLRRGSQTRELQLYVAKTSAELTSARALLSAGFPGNQSLVRMIINSTGQEFETVRLMCLSEASAPLEPVSVAAVVTADHRTRTKDDRLRVRLLSTRQTKQRQGLGSFLLKNLARIAATRGMPETFVEAAERKDNEVFWKKTGFPRLDEAARKRLETAIRQRSEQRLFSNIIVVQAPASFAFHFNVFQLRKGSSVVFSPAYQEPSFKGIIVDIDKSRKTCCVLKEGDDDGPTEFEGADVFDILPAATVECAICRELRRPDEMNRQPCCRQRACVVCDAKDDKCAYCRAAKS